MKSKFKSFIFIAMAIIPGVCQAYPQIDQVVRTGGMPISVYHDHDNPNQYWYIPQSIEPWSRDGLYKSALYKTDKALTFVFRGQASVDEEQLQKVAAALGTSINNFSPIPYEYSKNVVCQDVYSSADVQWLFPPMIGNYMEVVPVSIRTTNRDLIDEIGSIITNGGLACTVQVGFKANATAYDITFTADMSRVYERFEVAAHAEGLWWEVDMHALIQSLVHEGVINIKVNQDQTLPQTEIDKQQLAAFDGIEAKITEILFTPELKLPDGDMAGRGKPWSLRADYRKSTETENFKAHIQSGDVIIKDSQVSIRLATQ